MAKSLLDLAFDYVSQHKQSKFSDIWNYCVKEAGLTPEEASAKVSRFYTNLTLDGRFMTLAGNQWDLRVNHKYDSYHVDMSEEYSNDDTASQDPEENDEEDPYESEEEDDKSENDDDASSKEESDQDDAEDTIF